MLNELKINQNLQKGIINIYQYNYAFLFLKFEQKYKKNRTGRLRELKKGIMLRNHIGNLIREHIGYAPTPGQEELIGQLGEFIAATGEKEVMLVKGFAGTGKTSMVSGLVKVLPQVNLKFMLLAPTGRAAKMLSLYAGQSAYTIHKKIYRQRSAKDGFGDFVLNKNLFHSTVFIVDEASMIASQGSDLSIFGSGNLLDDLIEFVFSGTHNKLILVGDSAQLPPVGTDLSPALDRYVLESKGFRVREVFLGDIVRQAMDSGILHNATEVRKRLQDEDSSYPALTTTGFEDIRSIEGSMVTEEISNSYDRYGQDNTIIVCRSNKQANRYNAGIRAQLLGREEEISSGDYLMVVKNNYFWLQESDYVDFIANGDILKVEKILTHQERYGCRFADVVARFVDYPDLQVNVKIMLDTLMLDAASISNEKNKELYYSVAEDYSEVTPKKKQYEQVKKDPFFNALQVKFAYAVTCHKAQGGQWKSVFVDQGYISEEMLGTEYLRWLYTALTRATEKLYLVNFNNRFLKDR
jgi:exodeoxyribonuclease V